ncbi:helix-turn-helix domain-containing protein [Pseudomonas sp. Ga0074129]|uniref:helix-turn-helix domain-containing protein n=1 Tax=Pseudomonas sp. Ga0074129 TaxID=1752219 RepID=UPI000A488182|nr:helix-turn-helix domain-containing protein [Pseudomonas sp. Ga0074129]
MKTQKQKAAALGTRKTAPTLIASVLRHLLQTGSLNKYEGVNVLGDWSLSSTISDLANDYGVTITRTREMIGRSRQPVARYSIEASARTHALDVLALMDGKGKKVAA